MPGGFIYKLRGLLDSGYRATRLKGSFSYFRREIIGIFGFSAPLFMMNEKYFVILLN